MAKFIKSKFRVLWATVFSFFYGFFSTDLLAQEADDAETEDAVEENKDIVGILSMHDILEANVL